MATLRRQEPSQAHRRRAEVEVRERKLNCPALLSMEERALEGED